MSDEGFGDHGFQMMGMMNVLRTGDAQTDMILAMMLPFVLRLLFAWVSKLDGFGPEWWLSWFQQDVKKYERFISHTKVADRYGGFNSLDEDTQNSILLKAIKMYLNEVVKLDLDSGYIDLTEMKQNDRSRGYYSDSDDDSTGSEGNNNKTLSGRLSKYKIVNNLPPDTWYDIGEFAPKDKETPKFMVSMQMSTKTEEKGDGKEGNDKSSVHNTTYHFQSEGKHAIDAFIEEAYQWYLGELKKMEAKSNCRYYYEMKVPEIKIGRSNDEDSGGSGVGWKRYKLSDNKTFESLFFREKDELLGLIDHFNEKSGKYAIKGYPHKLGVLLHGPPGTGKTSLIKALAQYTGRSIVNVPLTRVGTNSELMSVFFDRSFKVDDQYMSVKLSFKDIIFVMEDVDAASKIVKRRDGREPADTVTTESIDLPTPKSLWRLFLESSSSDCKELVEKLMEESERLKESAEKQKPEVLQSIAQRLNNHPVLGLVDETMEDPKIAQVCDQAMEAVGELKEQREKLDEILSSHAEAISALLESDTEVTEEFVDELLGESRSLTAHLSATAKNETDSAPAAGEATARASMFPGAGFSPFGPEMGGDLEGPNAKKTGGAGNKMGSGIGSFLNPDALSLSGLLNVLDGVVDTPGRIVIMTTNHPEVLDPALIRPGRVDKKLLLGYMNWEDVVSMLELYFQTELDEHQVTRVKRVVDADGVSRSRLNMTPAQIEQLTAEHEDLEDMIQALEAKSPLKRPSAWISMVRNKSGSTRMKSGGEQFF